MEKTGGWVTKKDWGRETKKVEIETSRLAPIKDNLVQEANTGLQYANVVYALDEEVQALNSEDSMNDTKIRLTKKHLEKIKTDFPL